MCVPSTRTLPRSDEKFRCIPYTILTEVGCAAGTGG